MDILDAATLLARWKGHPHFERSCHGKVQHASENEARRQAKAQHKRMHKKYEAYPCNYCRAWHIGTKRKQVRRDPDARTPPKSRNAVPE